MPGAALALACREAVGAAAVAVRSERHEPLVSHPRGRDGGDPGGATQARTYRSSLRFG